ncbi:hypothetical protein GH811_17680 [Acetobacterium malicum]|uniref:Bacteriophage abortive infection AbiH n=1 Tax=Acetobacterium malicum TaxID=52692 RepID=A0ABR6Z1R9_9FIRM|nr:bacteriophage abortive infection AbiH family protein [Acetobacterium malicum]MBC3901434.1 hypothetical protein [Acetobacterium malicum]
MKLFIIGNGFDLGHGLKTSYYDFRKYMETEHWDFLIALEEPYNCVTGSKIECVKERLWKEFENNLAAINETEMIEWGSTIDLGLEGGDIDVYEPLEYYFNEMYSYIEELKKYLKLWVEQIVIQTARKTDKIDCGTEDLFLTFNYTLLLENVYGVDNERILHIHGSIDKEDEFPPAIGHGDSGKIKEAKAKASEAWENSEDKERAIYGEVAKYYESTLKDVPYYLRVHDHFFKSLNEIEEVHVVGHSFGVVDLPYFKKIMANLPETAFWNIYFHHENQREQLEKSVVEIGVKREKYTFFHTSEFFK